MATNFEPELGNPAKSPGPQPFTMKKSQRVSLYITSACLLCVGSLLILILIPLSFSKLDYNMAGLLQQKSTGEFDLSRVYGPGGLYFIGPDYTFKEFPMSLQTFDQRISVWSKSGTHDAGSTLLLDISFQYVLKQSELGNLYTEYAGQYAPMVHSYALDAIKNTAPLFGVDEYLTSREVVEATLRQNVTKKLADKMAVDVLDLQLRKIQLTKEQEAIKLTAAVQVEQNEKELYLQQARLINETTKLDVARIENQANIVAQSAVAQAAVITETAEYQARKLVEQARSDGLQQMLTDMGLTSDEHKASLDYITTLVNNKAKVTPYINMGQSGFLEKIVQ